MLAVIIGQYIISLYCFSQKWGKFSPLRKVQPEINPMLMMPTSGPTSWVSTSKISRAILVEDDLTRETHLLRNFGSAAAALLGACGILLQVQGWT